VNGIALLTSFSMNLLFVCRKATVFYILIFVFCCYLAEIHISDLSLPVDSLGSTKHRIISSANKDSLTSSFPICIFLMLLLVLLL
jgi:hypothetical protein